MSKKYTAIIDVDTLIIHAALVGQTTHVIARHKKTGWEKVFDNQTAFFGHYLKKEGGWLGELNATREVKVSADDFEIIPVVEKLPDVVQDDGSVLTAEIVVKGRFKNKIEAIANQPWCKDFKICFATGKSFRYDLAQTQPYKSERPVKPLLYEVVKEYMLWKYKDKLVIKHNVESDDIVTSELWGAWIKAERDHDKLDVVGCWIDKDLAQYPQLHYNFDKPELGLVKITPLEAAKSLAKQCLSGDNIDTIPGLPNLPEQMFEKYGIRKPNKPGLGTKTAEALIDPCETPKDAFERVVEAYKGFYGDVRMQFVSFDKEFSDRTWLEHLNEQFSLLRMRNNVNKEVGHVSKFLKQLEVNYD